MTDFKVNKTIEQINKKIASGDAVVVTAEEIIDIAGKLGVVEAAKKVDVVTTGTFAPMCSSGAFINIGQSRPSVRTTKTWLNNVQAYSGIAAVDCYIGATQTCDDDPLNKRHPGEFNYGGGHVIQDLVAGKQIHVRAESYGTDCYPNRKIEKMVTLKELPNAMMVNPRNCYQNYNCAINKSDKIIYTYMGTLKPGMRNANYCSAGELSPLLNDPYLKTIGVGTRIFLGGAQGYVTWTGTQHKKDVERGLNGVPLTPSGTLSVIGDLKQMSPEWLVGQSIRGYGVSLSVGLGIPIPILNEEILKYTSVSDDQLFTQIIDYGYDYPEGNSKSYGQVSYAELKSGFIMLKGKKIQTVPLSSMVKARKIADILKKSIQQSKFFIGQPQQTFY
ncbi:MAG: homocysteine biosynthesis protein [Proteobacteria bacterium]|nr:homocysteine biosynthesis protein [Pseudomonadota bacterium]MBU1386977.1 homocysteine biosynthesis protein [Pseudomonadota bacterium]MBU1542342.1 homocysteine biosynthesis protein [Pseudomonadota bacterium]MBU2430064.1 homocysteine biosynthesis protein [Pseudomonadota bacterium]MBU2481805.1 homocysteine biosynthesis protein [Pseudomonadota bacterium]